MIFRKRKAIFFHSGKTAGTAIEQMLLPGTRDPYVANRRKMFGYDRKLEIFLQHATCQTTLDIVGARIFRSYFKFSIVRNPFTRLLSTYYYLYDQNRKLYGSFRDYILRVPDIVSKPVKQRGCHQISQAYYTHLRGEQVVDYIGRFEQLDETVSRLNLQFGIDTVLPAVNVSRRPEYVALDERSAYDDEMIDIMREIYRDDFALYGYSSDPPEQ